MKLGGVRAIVLCVSALGSSNAAATDELSMQDVIAVAKMTGACGILQSMSAFQANTQLEAGDEFLSRFWQSEAARLGKSSEQYLKDCQAAIAAYERLWKLSEQGPQK